MKRLVPIIIVLVFLGGCASFSDLTDGLDYLQFHQYPGFRAIKEQDPKPTNFVWPAGVSSIDMAIRIFGYPNDERKIRDKVIYTWSTDRLQSYEVPDSYYVPYGQIQTYHSKTVSHFCTIRIIVDENGFIVDRDWEGNLGGCRFYIDSINKVLGSEYKYVKQAYKMLKSKQ